MSAVSSVGVAKRLSLRHRLTPGRLTSPGNPWSSGGAGSRRPYRYLYLHLLFHALQRRSRAAFRAAWNAPLPPPIAVRVFGAGLIPDYYPRRLPRPVSCYALFERMAASKPTSWLSPESDFVSLTQPGLRGLRRRSGFFSSRGRTLAPAPFLPGYGPRAFGVRKDLTGGEALAS